jgi:hypothetical protein
MHFLKVKPDGSFECFTGTCVRHRYRKFSYNTIIIMVDIYQYGSYRFSGFKYTGSYTLEGSVLELHIKHSQDLAEEDYYDNYYDKIPPICAKYTILS